MQCISPVKASFQDFSASSSSSCSLRCISGHSKITQPPLVATSTTKSQNLPVSPRSSAQISRASAISMMNIWLLVDRGAYTVNNWISQWCRCLVDDSWTILPALVQQALYDIGYRNPGLESLDIARRRRCFPPPPAPALTMRRVDVGHFLSQIYGWPSTGGVWTKTVDAVELVFLGIDPQHAKRCGNQMEEDDFCQRLKRLGARFYANEGAIRLSRVPDLGYDRVDIETDIDHELDIKLAGQSTAVSGSRCST